MFAQKQTVSRTDGLIPQVAVPPSRSQAIPPATSSIQGYAARRSYAFDLAEDAYWQGLICADAYMLFRLLARLCKDKTYCWPGLDYLAERMQTSIGTIKRRLDVLERAGLVARRQRAGGLTSYTYVRPLQEYDATQDGGDDAGTSGTSNRPPASCTMTPTTSMEPNNTSTSRSIMSDTVPAGRATEALFFVPTLEINTVSPDRSALIPHTVKSQNINAGGGGSVTKCVDPCSITPIKRLLEQAGVLSPIVMAELQNTPLAEVEACLTFARRQRNIADPTGFAVSLIRLGMGPKLLERALTRPQRSRAAGTPAPLITSVADPAGYAYYHCGHGRVRGAGCPNCQTNAGEEDQMRPADGQVPDPFIQTLPPHLGDATDGQLSALWAQALAELYKLLPQAEFETWLQETQLVGWLGEAAIVGTPNIFAREHVAQVYGQRIADVLGELVGRTTPVRVVVNSG